MKFGLPEGIMLAASGKRQAYSFYRPMKSRNHQECESDNAD